MKHERDEPIPAEFIRHVGNVLRCTCGAAYVAGYKCPRDMEETAVEPEPPACRVAECPHLETSCPTH